MDFVTEEFQAGVEAYYECEVPKGWDDPERRAHSPFLTGWFMASEADNYGDDWFNRKGKAPKGGW